MRKRLSTADLLALMAAAGVASTGIAQATNQEAGATRRAGSLQVIEAPARSSLADKDKDMACGKGACGTDESGAKAAEDKHASGSKDVDKGTKSPGKSSKAETKKSPAKKSP